LRCSQWQWHADELLHGLVGLRANDQGVSFIRRSDEMLDMSCRSALDNDLSFSRPCAS